MRPAEYDALTRINTAAAEAGITYQPIPYGAGTQHWWYREGPPRTTVMTLHQVCDGRWRLEWPADNTMHAQTFGAALALATWLELLADPEDLRCHPWCEPGPASYACGSGERRERRVAT